VIKDKKLFYPTIVSVVYFYVWCNITLLFEQHAKASTAV